MKVLHINYSDIEGGAARGAYWLHKALLQQNVKSEMLVARKRSKDSEIHCLQGFFDKSSYNLNFELFDSLPLHQYENRKTAFFSPAYSMPLISNPFIKYVHKLDPDIVNIHWAGHGLLSPEDFRELKKPIVLTLRDMWSFTGGCHYSEECERYKLRCGACPQLESPREKDISRKLWQRKLKSWEGLNMTIVPISQWLADSAIKSPLLGRFDMQVIHNALDTKVFKPLNKGFSREVLGLPKDKKIVLFGAINATTDKRKGFSYLQAATQLLAQRKESDNIELAIFGTSKPDTPLNLGLPVRYLGTINDDITLSLVYSSADVSVVPSIQEAFGKTIIESMACGTPVVSFDATGPKDIIDHKENGYRAKPFSFEDLAKGITWSIQHQVGNSGISSNAREKVLTKFSLDIQAKAYMELYQSILF